MTGLLRLGLAVLFTGSAAHTALAAPAISQIFAFGDSYSDNGALLALTQQMVAAHLPEATLLPADVKSGTYWQGRWSNGPTAIEDLAQSLHVNLTDYAMGGAKTGDGNYYAWLDTFRDTGLLGQVRQFEERLGGGKADPEALYFVAASANDYFQMVVFSRTETAEILADRAAANTRDAVVKLDSLGAHKFLISTSYDLDALPVIRTDPKTIDSARRFRQRYDAALAAMLRPVAREPKVSIVYFDWGAETEKIAAEAGRYGITDTKTPCQVTLPAPKPSCPDPGAYLFWDEYHPTGRAHRLLAEAMVRRLKP